MPTVVKKIDNDMTVDAPDPRPQSILAVIPTLNEELHIEACIRSLMTGDEALKSIPLIVADGGSTDATVAIVRTLMMEFPNLKVIPNPKRLQSAALNLAVREMASDASKWLVRCDAHSLYPDNFILDVARALQTTRAESVVIPMDAVGNTCFEKANAWIVDTPLGSGGAAHRGGQRSQYVDHGHHAGFSIPDFRRLGGYDETFSHNEDAEYDTRLTASGGRIFLDADIRIRYIPRGTVRRLAKQYYQYGKGRSRNATKHKTPLKIRQLLPVIALIAILAALAIAPVSPMALIVPLGYFGVLAAASFAMLLKHRSLCGLLAGIALGVMHMSWALGFLSHKIGIMLTRGRRAGPPESVIRKNTNSAVSTIGRSVLGLFSIFTGRSTVETPDRPANENFPAHHPVTRVTHVPDGQCVYAIGDIHGRLDLLEALLERIDADAADLPLGTKTTIVFLGDYIDRGLQSRQIVDLFLGDRLAKHETVFLMGNHEEALLNFIQDPSFGEKWAMYGGSETLFSYGLQPPTRHGPAAAAPSAQDAWMAVWQQFRSSLPEAHLTFYQSLKLSHTIGDYIFVHAGLKPGVPLAEQVGEDMLWIREEFLTAKGTFEKLVVHGHTPVDRVHRDNRRIALDTGAYMTGRLTAARFLKQDIEYIST
ncbi:MAG: glycosyltransferase [Pseudomonadota bacterium]